MAASLGTISKSYVSAVDPIIDTREINKLVTDVYNEDMLSDILGYGNKKCRLNSRFITHFTMILL